MRFSSFCHSIVLVYSNSAISDRNTMTTKCGLQNVINLLGPLSTSLLGSDGLLQFCEHVFDVLFCCLLCLLPLLSGALSLFLCAHLRLGCTPLQLFL